MNASTIALATAQATAQATGKLEGVADERKAILRFLRQTARYWSAESNKFRAARCFTMAEHAEVKVLILEAMAMDLEEGCHRRRVDII